MSHAVNQMDTITQQNAALAEESAATAATLIQQIGQLNRLVSTFKVTRPGKSELWRENLGLVA